MTRVRAPELRGGEWLNGPAHTLRDLRGRWVLLDFWTGACINCVHTVEELRPLEAEGVVTVLGVHSPKFEHETDRRTVEAAIARYGVHHPVLNDPDRRVWDDYAVDAWPTLVLVDPQGYIAQQVSGEGHVAELSALVHDRAGTTGAVALPSAAAAPDVPGRGLRFPGGLLTIPPGRAPRHPDGALLVSDTGHRRLLLREEGEPGEGADEGAVVEGFTEPLGAALLPAEVAAEVGYDVVVADGVGNRLVAVRLGDLSVREVATGLVSPWDVAWFDGRVVVAMAGRHRLVSFDPRSGATTPYAGTGREGLVDGPADRAWFAQPSGLAVAGERLWVADPESSALRLVQRLEGGVQVRTVVGQGLFEFGHVDGPAAGARLQHPLGVAGLPDGSVAIADTYNGAVRRYDPATDEVGTLADGLEEPAALALAADGALLVAESAGHRVSRVEIRDDARRHLRRTTLEHPIVDLSPSVVTLAVAFTPPPGQHLDARDGDPTRLRVTATPADVLVGGAGSGSGLERELRFDGRLTGGRTDGVLRVNVQAAACDEGEGAACHLFRREWDVPFRLVTGAATRLDLHLPATPPTPF